MAQPATTFESNPKPARTFAEQDKLPKLPIPPLEDTCRRYLTALRGLQDDQEHENTRRAVEAFLAEGGDGQRLQEKLQKWAEDKASYIEDFWYESYLSHSDPVVLALNPFFVLENDPTPDRGSQLGRAASLILSSLGFVHDLRAGILDPDTVRGTPLDMDQYTRLFGTARIPTERGCKMITNDNARHIVVMRHGQMYWFDVMDTENRPLLTEREVLRNLQAIVKDADKTPTKEVARNAIGVLSTENRKTWSRLRSNLSKDRTNASCLQLIDDALFIVCLDDATPKDLADLCANFLCGTYDLQDGVQVGTCTNRWYDKLQIIVCGDGAAGINFEHSGVDGHTVLRFAADVYTEGLMLLARSINPSAPTLFHAPLSPHSKSYKPPKSSGKASHANSHSLSQMQAMYDTAPKKLEWALTPEVRVGIRFAETRLSDLICQNDCQALEFKGYGKNFITSHGFSPDAFVQMAFQAAYFGLYGRTECTYEPAMTKAFLHGRTEAIRTVQPESVDFTKTFFSEASAAQKVSALHKACERHVKLTKECSQGLGQDRHLYALQCIHQRDVAGNLHPSPDDPVNGFSNHPVPSIFADPGWSLLSTSILSTSNCGNPALRLFGFGPVAADGYGIGYIIKENGISIVASSKHLQTRRFLDTLQSYLHDVQRVLVQLHRSANERPAPFVDHAGILRDSKTGRPISGQNYVSDGEEDYEDTMPGYSFFDSGDIELLGGRKKSPYANVGKTLPMSDW
ncbi:carnitine acetyl transferase [Coniophora puteana RWD-64-598 SS2]|uniref:Carnitine acetyl transferase n=1 Tax=Coniophora puteana (strain RWD-64-598) TaxID=741705 RepID=R7SEB0_CONPW|nr:carnitine acetyl transferase [Coniophora puteana RWD-64-598 SS2]EIW74513.1 carnitine acetyl transferase [Coniophora puteana RWD-64-598 SS2]